MYSELDLVTRALVNVGGLTTTAAARNLALPDMRFGGPRLPQPGEPRPLDSLDAIDSYYKQDMRYEINANLPPGPQPEPISGPGNL